MKKKLIIGAAVLILILLGGLFWFRSAYIQIGGTWFSRSEEILDLREIPLSAADFEALRAELPGSEILWNPPFQGEFLPADTAEITVLRLTDGDVEALDYFENLQTLDGTGCEDYPQLAALTLRRPEVKVLYSIGGFDQDTQTAEIENAHLSEVRMLLDCLPKLNSVFLKGGLPPVEEIQALSADYPGRLITYEANFFGRIISATETALDLTGEALTVEEISAALPYLPNLTTVSLFETGLGQAEVESLQEAFPEITFHFDFALGDMTVRTDAEEIDISGVAITPEAIEDKLHFFPNLKKVIMCNCGISNEDMDTLNRRHEDIQFVWSVSLNGRATVRTDITGFITFKMGLKYFFEGELDNLRYCTELVALDLGHQKISNCDFVAYMPNLKYLVLADTTISDLTPLEGLENLEFLEIFLTNVQDYTPLLKLTNLKDLNLAWTYGDYKIIGQMPWLERVWWGGKWHNMNERAYLTEHCPDTKFEFDDGESTGSGWRTGYLYYEMRDALGMFYME